MTTNLTTNPRLRKTTVVLHHEMAEAHKRSQSDVAEALARIGEARPELVEDTLKTVAPLPVGGNRRKKAGEPAERLTTNPRLRKTTTAVHKALAETLKSTTGAVAEALARVGTTQPELVEEALKMVVPLPVGGNRKKAKTEITEVQETLEPNATGTG